MAARQPFGNVPYADVGYWDALSAPPRPSFSARVLQVVYGFVWMTTVFAALGGLIFALYRNDVLLSLAVDHGAEARYLQWEKDVFGVPGWGTPRSVRPTELGAASLTAAEPDVQGAATSAEPTPSVASAPAAVAVAPSAPPEPTQLSAPTSVRETPPAKERVERSAVLSVESLPTTKKSKRSGSSRSTFASSAPARQDDDDDGEALIEVRDPEPQRASRATEADEDEAPISRSTKAKRAVERDEEPLKVATREPAKKKESSKAPPPAPAAADDNPLKAAIRSAILKDAAEN